MTMTKADWLALADHCEQAKGPDREIDFKIGFATGWRKDIIDGCEMVLDWDCNAFPNHYGALLPSVTESLDAITAQIEREFPGYSVASGYCSESHEDRSDDPDLDQPQGGWATLWSPDCDGDGHGAKGSATEPLARSAAFCRAKAEVCDE